MMLGHSNFFRYNVLMSGLLAAFAVPDLLVQEPLGAGSLAILIRQILSLAEILQVNYLQGHSIGPSVLGVPGSSYFFTTVHPEKLSSIQ
jgi:phosphatidylinositol glycan class O